MTVIALLVTLGILVTVHEFGHFWVARRCGVKVLRFSVGFGKPLFSWHDRQGTEFVIAALPLGGYVKMLDAREGDISDADKAQEFTGKSVYQRFAIVSAGPLANFIFAIFAYWILFMVGVSGIKPYVSDITTNSIAGNAGMIAPLLITHIDGQPVSTWQDARLALFERAGDQGFIGVTADSGQEFELPIERWLSDNDIQDPIILLGLLPLGSFLDAELSTVQEGSAAEKAGLLPGDIIVAVDDVTVAGWDGLVSVVQRSPNLNLRLQVDRDGWMQEISVTPELKEGGLGYLGVSPVIPDAPDDFFVTVQYNPIRALWFAAQKTYDTVGLSFSMFGKMVTGSISAQNIGGPVAIAKLAGQSAASGPEVFLGFLAFISISLGVVNLLPIPVLDGGHLLFYGIEWVRGKPLSDRIQAVGFRLGSSVLVMVMIYAIMNDIVKLMS